MKDLNNAMYDPSDKAAIAPITKYVEQKSMEGAYNEPGLPKPPAGYGKKLGFEPQVPDSIGC